MVGDKFIAAESLSAVVQANVDIVVDLLLPVFAARCSGRSADIVWRRPYIVQLAKMVSGRLSVAVCAYTKNSGSKYYQPGCGNADTENVHRCLSFDPATEGPQFVDDEFC